MSPTTPTELEVGGTYWVRGLICGRRRMVVKRQDARGRWHLRVLGPLPKVPTDFRRQPYRSVLTINGVGYEVVGRAFTGVKLERQGPAT